MGDPVQALRPEITGLDIFLKVFFPWEQELHLFGVDLAVGGSHLRPFVRHEDVEKLVGITGTGVGGGGFEVLLQFWK